MQYQGGKHLIAKRIAKILEAVRMPGQPFVDLMCGGLNVTAAMGAHGPRCANDGNKALIRLYQAWRDEGWRPPEEIPESLYRELKSVQDPNDPLTAFAGTACAYGGMWFSTYARGWWKGSVGKHVPKGTPGSYPEDFVDRGTRGLEKKMALCQDVEFTSYDFSSYPVKPGDLVYADPPYKGTSGYRYFKGRFDYDLFLRKTREWVDLGADVWVSEYDSQDPSWELVAEFKKKRTMGGRGKPQTRVDRLFRVR